MGYPDSRTIMNTTSSPRPAGARRMVTFCFGFVLGILLISTYTMFHKAARSMAPNGMLEGEISVPEASRKRLKQYQKAAAHGGGSHRLPSKEHWVKQSRGSRNKKQQPPVKTTSSGNTTKSIAENANMKKEEIRLAPTSQEKIIITHEQLLAKAAAGIVTKPKELKHSSDRRGSNGTTTIMSDLVEKPYGDRVSNTSQQVEPVAHADSTTNLSKPNDVERKADTTGAFKASELAIVQNTASTAQNEEITDPSKLETNTTTTFNVKTEVVDFVKQPGVVIAVKIHGPGHVIQLKQSLCLLKAAYNDRVIYDIMVFVTEPLSNNEIRDLRDIVHPAHLIIETDKLTLSQQVDRMTKAQRTDLLNRCDKNTTEELFWWTRCCDENNKGECMPLAYNWQAEFRSKWIWYNKELAKYRWMMWYDSDAMATKVWQQDPVAFAIRNDLKMLFDHFPQGWRASELMKGMMQDAYDGDFICDVKLVDGHLEALRKDCPKPKIPQIHGFFHVTDLDFYRSEANLKWFNNMIGDRKFTRTWDDQLAVTVPAAVLAANKSWDMNANGIQLDIYHNQYYDGQTKRRFRGGGFVKWWENKSATEFPEAIQECAPFVKNSG